MSQGDFEQRLQAIEERNARVEADKAWETSRFRICAIILITYLLTTLVFWLIGVADFWLNAFIPTLGYFLSMQSLPILKKWWLGKGQYIDIIISPL